jgi:ADP-ribose pyrophosphatase
VLETPWIRVVSKPIVRPSDQRTEPYYVVEAGDWSMICPRRADGRFVMIEQFRPAVGCTVLEFPAGGIDPGETAETSIARELIEETGYRAVRLVPLGAYFADTGRLNNRTHLFFGDVEAAAGATPEPGLTVRDFTAADIDRMVQDGRLAALHHVGLWLMVRAQLRATTG